MRRIIIDTDIGTDVDDALALALAATTLDAQLLGVTTVHADASLRARIATRLLRLAGRPDVPVVAGASLPLAMPLPARFHWLPRLWGHEGAGILEPEERAPTADVQASADDAARFIVETALAHRGEVSLIAIGPLTNVARALQLEPRLTDWLCDLTLMGGMIDPSKTDWPPVLETNLNADPGAAEIVFAAGLPLTMVPVEVTTQVFLTPEQRAVLRSCKHPLAGTLVALMEEMLARFAHFSEEQSLPNEIFAGRTFMHDPLAVYTAIATRLVTVRRTCVRLEVHDRVLRTIAHPDRRANVWVCVDVDAPGLVGYWLDSIKGLAT